MYTLFWQERDGRGYCNVCTCVQMCALWHVKYGPGHLAGTLSIVIGSLPPIEHASLRGGGSARLVRENQNQVVNYEPLLDTYNSL